MILMLAAMAVVSVMAEPPARSQYLPPERQNAFSQPPNQYGTPAEFNINVPSNQYGAPSNIYGVPSQSTNDNKLLAQFGASSVISGRFGGANMPYNRQGTPDASTRALIPSSQHSAPTGSGKFGGARTPSGQYGAPATSNIFTSGRSGSANIPSNQYGVPGVSIRAAAVSSLSTQYGGPVASSRFGDATLSSSSRFNGAGSPKSQYVAAAAPSRFGDASSLSSSHLPSARSQPNQSDVPSRLGGARSLSSQFGASGSSSRLGGTGSLSTQYGAPSAFSRFNAPTSQYAPGGGYAASRARYNAQEDDLAEPANYEFSYEVQDPESGSEFSQEESRQDENAQGSYRVLLPDGRLQIVEYEADQEGYRPQIRYEDTGAGYPSGPQQRGQSPSQGPY